MAFLVGHVILGLIFFREAGESWRLSVALPTPLLWHPFLQLYRYLPWVPNNLGGVPRVAVEQGQLLSVWGKTLTCGSCALGRSLVHFYQSSSVLCSFPASSGLTGSCWRAAIADDCNVLVYWYGGKYSISQQNDLNWSKWQLYLTTFLLKDRYVGNKGSHIHSRSTFPLMSTHRHAHSGGLDTWNGGDFYDLVSHV